MAGDQNEQEMSMEEILASIRKIIATDEDMDGAEEKTAAAPAPESKAPEQKVAAAPQEETKPTPAPAPLREDPVVQSAPQKPQEDLPKEPQISEEKHVEDEEDFLELTEEIHDDGSVKDLKVDHHQESSLEQNAESLEQRADNEDLMKGLSSIMENAPVAEEEEEEEAVIGTTVEAQAAEDVVEENPIEEDITIEKEFRQEEHHQQVYQEEMGIEKEMAETLENEIISGETAAAASHRLKGLRETIERKAKEDEISRAITVDVLVTDAIRPMLKEWLDENLPALVEKVVEKEIKRFVDKSV